MKSDMSSTAVTRRLRQTSQLRRLCLALGSQRLSRGAGEKRKSANKRMQAKANSHA